MAKEKQTGECFFYKHWPSLQCEKK